MNWFIFRQHEAHDGLIMDEPAIILIEAFDHDKAREVLAGLPITGLDDEILNGVGYNITTRWSTRPSQAYAPKPLIYDCAFDHAEGKSYVGYFEVQDWVNNACLNPNRMNALVVLSDGARLTFRPA